MNDSGEVLNPALVDSFSFNTDLQSMNCRAKVKLKDITHSLYNEIKTGLSVNFVFFDTENSQTTYTNYMKVLSFNKKPSTNETLYDSIDVELISRWYFDNTTPSSSSYTGNYSQIVNQVLSNTENKYYNLDLSSTEDNIRYRYRIEETDQEFLTRMMKYGRIGSLPVYLYADTKGNIKLRGIKEFVNNTSEYYISPDTAQQLATIPSNASNLKYIRMTAYKVSSDTSTSNSKSTTKFTTSNFKLNQTAQSKISINNTEIQNSQAYDYTPARTSFLNWNLTPDDALSVAAKSNFENNMYTYSITCIIPGIVEDLDIGDKLKVYLPFKPVQGRKAGTITNLGEGEYFIKRLDYIWQNSQYRTRLEMIQASYS